MAKWASLVLWAVMLLAAAGCSGPSAGPPQAPAPAGVESTAPEAPAAPGPDLWPGVPPYPGAGQIQENWGYQVIVTGAGTEKVMAWYRGALKDRGWGEEAVSDFARGLLVVSRKGVYVSVAISAYEQGAVVNLHRRDRLKLTEAEAVGVAKAILAQHESGVAWEVRDAEAYPDEAKGEGVTRPTWIVGRVYSGGNKEVVYVDALTAEPYRVATLEGPGAP